MEKIKDMEKNNYYDTVLLVKKVEERETKQGSSYVIVTLTDGDKKIEAKVWDCTTDKFGIEPPNLVYLRLSVGFYNDQLDYTVKQWRPIRESDPVRLEDYIETPPVPVDQMYEEILHTVQKFQNKFLKELVLTILMKYETQFKSWGAAKDVHHNVKGGLLYHVYRMMRMGLCASKVYPDINKDILIAGIVLHDIGKLREMETDMVGTSTYTVDGNLMGHLVLGSDIVKEFGEQLGTPAELIRVLRHIILSHHGKPEWGAVKAPCMAEAMLVHEIDMIDSRIYQFEKIGADLEPGTMAETRAYTLDGVFVYAPLEM